MSVRKPSPCIDCGKTVHRAGGRCASCAHTHSRCKRSLEKLLTQIPVGSKHGRLEVTGRPVFRSLRPGGKPRWWVAVRCQCGTEKDVLVQNIFGDHTVSCGCSRNELSVERLTTHGGCGTTLYRTWAAMRARCHSPGHACYKDYGARGIVVCEAWRTDFVPFRDWALANGWRRELEIDRRDNDGPYSPENCRWVTHKVNNRNKRDSLMLEAFGESKCLAEWAEDPRCLVGEGTLRARTRYGWAAERAIATPVVSREECLRVATEAFSRKSQDRRRAASAANFRSTGLP